MKILLVESCLKMTANHCICFSDPSSSSLASSPSALSSTTSTDYYGSIADATSTRGHGESSPLQSCVHILSIY